VCRRQGCPTNLTTIEGTWILPQSDGSKFYIGQFKLPPPANPSPERSGDGVHSRTSGDVGRHMVDLGGLPERPGCQPSDDAPATRAARDAHTTKAMEGQRNHHRINYGNHRRSWSVFMETRTEVRSHKDLQQGQNEPDTRHRRRRSNLQWYWNRRTGQERNAIRGKRTRGKPRDAVHHHDILKEWKKTVVQNKVNEYTRTTDRRRFMIDTCDENS
jgi:hypothetical protein